MGLIDSVKTQVKNSAHPCAFVCMACTYRRRTLIQDASLIGQAALLYRQLYRKGRVQHFLITGTGVGIFMRPHSVIKVPLTHHAHEDLARSTTNTKRLKKGPLAPLMPYRITRVKHLYVMTRLWPHATTPSEREKALKTLQKSVKKQKANQTDIWKNITFEEPALNALKERLTQQKIWRVGPMHGDFTPSNIMQNHQGKIALIDLDRYSEAGFLEFDNLHYDIEKESKEKQQRFLHTLHTRLQQKALTQEKRAELALYLVYRLHLETRDGANLPKHEAALRTHLAKQLYTQLT